jgi:hypothetical protein
MHKSLQECVLLSAGFEGVHGEKAKMKMKRMMRPPAPKKREEILLVRQVLRINQSD